ncbi:MAG: bifunctional 5,10-methylenetetrahydrofolate dehydrogenase/5,10-methenyltetrahydrofolate cyclohydrolase [Pseudomonadota bacterium]|nr:bifunctional 5,10-methylenetetrahydrofolate dehydrogenase/5,10-methenyltetrahydrofolate cyclohydrolase [Pseudomonadota bacterium]
MTDKNKLINGSMLAKNIIENIQLRWAHNKSQSSPPSLAIIQVGNDHASSVYIRHKMSACRQIGFLANCFNFPDNCTQSELTAKITDLNQDIDTHGILLQLPLPPHLDKLELLKCIDPSKDVDAIGPTRLGNLINEHANILPCTTAAILYLIKQTGISLPGKKVTMIGASSLVGKPTAIELLNRHATVTVCHSQTTDLATHAKQADILIVAIGNPHVIQPSWIKKNSIVIDVGINRSETGKVIGDIDTASVLDTVQFITPVPGGVGPLTVAHLVKNLYTLYCIQQTN